MFATASSAQWPCYSAATDLRRPLEYCGANHENVRTFWVGRLVRRGHKKDAGREEPGIQFQETTVLVRAFLLTSLVSFVAPGAGVSLPGGPIGREPLPVFGDACGVGLVGADF